MHGKRKGRLKEHKRAVRVGDNNSKVAQHANQFGHSIDFDHATIVDKARNFHERLFLEAWYSQRDSNAGRNILISRMFINPSCDHAQQSFVMSCWRSTRTTVNRYKAVTKLALKKPMKAEVVWPKRLYKFY